MTITSFTPSGGSNEGLTEVTVTGTNYPTDYTTGFELKVGNVIVSDVTFVSSTSIKFFTPRSSLVNETANIILTFEGKTGTSGSAFGYTNNGMPIVSSISPV